jgi:hypothetical protein
LIELSLIASAGAALLFSITHTSLFDVFIFFWINEFLVTYSLVDIIKYVAAMKCLPFFFCWGWGGGGMNNLRNDLIGATLNCQERKTKRRNFILTFL